MAKKSNKDKPLSCAIEGDQLVIRIGINTLAHAAENCPLLYDHENSDMPYATVIDKCQLAKDVIREIEREKEDGSSPLSDMLDQAFVDAIGDGSLAFDQSETLA